ncbi:unnamed protein product [Linum tenue]|uniref:Uncharacterized protein n=1 Tax=Linum tenue TaxID=586396 RepID=A0AAV0MDT7_9ROSI|nr:unnamed protein product [Linum tenue]
MQSIPVIGSNLKLKLKQQQPAASSQQPAATHPKAPANFAYHVQGC